MSTYEHGSQDISDKRATYAAITRLTLWSAVLIGLATFYLSMVFAAGVNWFQALVIVYVISLAIGFGLRRGGSWYATMTGLAVGTAVIGWIVSLISAMM